MTSLPASLPDLDVQIDAALSELDRSALEAKVHNDPLQLPFAALASFLRAQRQLHADTIVEMQRGIEAAKQPMRDEDLRRAVIQGVSAHAGGAVRTMGWRNMLIGVAMVSVALMGGAGAGYWFRGKVPVLVGVQAGAEKCDDRPDGSRLCWIPIFERLPR